MTDSPHVAAEKIVLGSILAMANNSNGEDATAEAIGIVRADDFSEFRNQAVFTAAVDLWNEGKRPDTVAVGELLNRRGQWDDVRPEYLVELFENAHLGNVAYYARLVRDGSILRQIDLLGAEMQRVAAKPTDTADNLLGQFEQHLQKIAGIGAAAHVKRMSETVSSVFDAWDQRKCGNRNDIGLHTGYQHLDDVIVGLQGGRLYVVGARTSVGKTALAANIAVNLARGGHPVLFVSLEQSAEEICERMLSAESSVSAHVIRQNWADGSDARRFNDAGHRVRSLPILFDDTPSQTATRICATARRMKRKEKIAAVFIDYLGLIEPEDGRRTMRYEQIGVITRRLKLMARDLNIPVVLLAQLNREADDRDKPRLSDLRESGSIEQDADVVLLMHRVDDQSLIEIQVAKNRGGPVADVRLRFRKEYTRFENYAPAGIDI